MARKNQKYAIYVLASIVVLSLVVYPSFSATGKTSYEPAPDTSCSDYFYPGDCEAAGCTWTESGCADGSGGGFPFPGEEPDPCDGLGFWNCIATEGCTWDFLNNKCFSGRVVACGILDYQECIDDPDCHWEKKADGSCECAAGGSDILPRQCENCIFEPQLGEVDVDCSGNCPPCRVGQNCNDHADCQSEFCDFIPYMGNAGRPTFKCKVCDPSSGNDNIQNCGETGIDCGISYPCHCFNNKLDQGEAAIDCSDPDPTIDPNPICPLCIKKTGQLYTPHCFDDVLSKGESCIDCGGSCSHIKVCDLSYKKVTLKDVSSASTATVVVDVAGTSEVVSTKAETVNGVSIKAVQAFYEENKSDRAAELIIDRLGKVYLKVGEFRYIQTDCYDSLVCNLAGYFWCSDQDICWDDSKARNTCFLSKTTCKAGGYFWCDLDNKCYDYGKAPASCFDNKQDCNGAGLFWCDRTGHCEAKKRADCHITKLNCENDGFWWCDAGYHKGSCFSTGYPYCLFTKTDCEKYNHFWCAGTSKCLYQGEKCECWQTKNTCETNNCDWCNTDSYCIIEGDTVDCDCFITQQVCQKHSGYPNYCRWVATSINGSGECEYY